ncbi:hypothetical protein AM609_00520 [Actinomyces sp. oral taxon 414]|nr:hypothetical protein AM609_00520 [Actinomyces sp. oral taxon 414]
MYIGVSRPQRPGQTQDRRTHLDFLLAQPGEQVVELIICVFLTRTAVQKSIDVTLSYSMES